MFLLEFAVYEKLKTNERTLSLLQCGANFFLNTILKKNLLVRLSSKYFSLIEWYEGRNTLNKSIPLLSFKVNYELVGLDLVFLINLLTILSNSTRYFIGSYEFLRGFLYKAIDNFLFFRLSGLLAQSKVSLDSNLVKSSIYGFKKQAVLSLTAS